MTYHIILIPPSLPPTIFFSIPSIVCKNVPLFPRSICQSGSFAVISLLFVSSILFTFHKSALKWLFSKARHSPMIKVSRLTARNSSSSSSSFASSKIPQIHQRITYRTYTVSTKLPTNRMRTVSLRNGFGDRLIARASSIVLSLVENGVRRPRHYLLSYLSQFNMYVRYSSKIENCSSPSSPNIGPIQKVKNYLGSQRSP